TRAPMDRRRRYRVDGVDAEGHRVAQDPASGYRRCSRERVARENPKNILQAFLTSLTWDGEKRMHTLLSRGFGGVALGDEHRQYIEAVSRCFLVSLAARAMHPGCKADHLLVLEGPQGGLKSSALEIIGQPFFNEVHAKIDSKDFYLSLRGNWLIELSELSSI